MGNSQQSNPMTQNSENPTSSVSSYTYSFDQSREKLPCWRACTIIDLNYMCPQRVGVENLEALVTSSYHNSKSVAKIPQIPREIGRNNDDDDAAGQETLNTSTGSYGNDSNFISEIPLIPRNSMSRTTGDASLQPLRKVASAYHNSNSVSSRTIGDAPQVSQVPLNISQIQRKTNKVIFSAFEDESIPLDSLLRVYEDRVIKSINSSKIPVTGTEREGNDIVARKKTSQWTEDEHKLFLLGLEKYGKGDWKSISRNYVKTRSSTQVPSHAQKYYIRRGSMKSKKRSSIHDITSVDDNSIVDLYYKGILPRDEESTLQTRGPHPETHPGQH